MVKVCSPVAERALTLTLTVSKVPVSRKTTATVPASLLVILGNPEKPLPAMVSVTVLPIMADPLTLTASNVVF